MDSGIVVTGGWCAPSEVLYDLTNGAETFVGWLDSSSDPLGDFQQQRQWILDRYMQGSSVDPSDDWAIGYPEHPTSTERTQEVTQTGVQDWMSDEEKAAVGAAGRERITQVVDHAIGDVERPRYHWRECDAEDPQGCYGCSLHGGHCGHCPMARPTTDPGFPTIGVQRGGPQWTWNPQWHRNHYAQGDAIIQEERATTEDLRAAHYPGPTSHPGTGTFLRSIGQPGIGMTVNDNQYSVIADASGINQAVATGHTYATHTQLVEALADADRRLMDATERFDKRLRKMEKKLRKQARRG